MNDWLLTSVGAVSTRVTKGTTPKLGGYTTRGISFVKVESITAEGQFIPEKFAYINEETNQLLARSILQEDDLLFSIAGTIGRVARVSAQFLPANTNQALAIIRPDKAKINVGFLLYCLRDKNRIQDALSLVVQSVQANLSLSELSSIQIPLPPLAEQQAIAEVLGALDDKIAANTKLAATAAQLSHSLFTRAVKESSDEHVLSEITNLLNRGVTPKYSEDEDTMMILNQKCVRGQRIELEPARRTLLTKVREDKVLVANDVLVNSTGQGTLGRVARWTNQERATVDSHITIVRFDAAKVHPVTAGIGLLGLQETIIEMGEGSTGQTELSRVELGKLKVRLPRRDHQAELGLRFSELSRMESAHLAENETLSTTRDALLPQLMSGKLRVKDAESAVGSFV